jgi:hypothetical protein
LHAEFYNVYYNCKEALVVGAIVLAISLELVVVGDNDGDEHVQQSDSEDQLKMVDCAAEKNLQHKKQRKELRQ